jgi:septum site-determining protein MinC
MDDQSGRNAHQDHAQLYRQESEGKQSVQDTIAIKGTRNGLLLTLEPGTPFSELLHALTQRLDEAPSFFRGASLTVDASQRALRSGERSQLEKLLALYHMSIHSSAPEHKPKEAKTITLPPETPLPPAALITQNFGAPTRDRDPRDFDDTLFLRRTVRSGQAMHHHGSIIILGDVNPGAEVVSGGDIIVWGVLRGMVHAGYPDNEHALVCALQLAPVQLRIAHLLSRPPEGFEAQPQPEVASIRQGQIMVETWVGGRPPHK